MSGANWAPDLPPGSETDFDPDGDLNASTIDEEATPAGWIDPSADGAFNDAGELVLVQATTSRRQVLMLAATTRAVRTLARSRILPGEMADPRPTGPATTGDTEYHPDEPTGIDESGLTSCDRLFGLQPAVQRQPRHLSDHFAATPPALEIPDGHKSPGGGKRNKTRLPVCPPPLNLSHLGNRPQTVNIWG